MFHIFVRQSDDDWSTYCGYHWVETEPPGAWVDALTLDEWLVEDFHSEQEPCEACVEKVCPLKMLAVMELE